MRFFFVSACLVTILCASVAVAQSPVAYVYVAEDSTTVTPTSPISVYAASSSGELTQIKGSPFKQTSGYMVGTNGTHFITVDDNPATTDQYLRVYDVASDGVIGDEISKRDLHEWCRYDDGAVLDHTGQYVYVLDGEECGGKFQSFALSKSGELTFEGSLAGINGPHFALPVFSGNDKFAYISVPTQPNDSYCSPPQTYLGLRRASSGALETINYSETDPTSPAGYQTYQGSAPTGDPTDHLASLVVFQNGLCGPSFFALASYTIESNGDLVSTNTYENMPQLAGNLANSNAGIELNPAGNILAAAVGTGIQFFHFNGANPITTFTGVIGTSGFISAMAWDKDNHLYALNGSSGRLHVYTVTTSKVVEAKGSPYVPPNNCVSGECPGIPTLIVRSIP